jgi:hypothetical protein
VELDVLDEVLDVLDAPEQCPRSLLSQSVLVELDVLDELEGPLSLLVVEELSELDEVLDVLDELEGPLSLLVVEELSELDEVLDAPEHCPRSWPGQSVLVVEELSELVACPYTAESVFTPEFVLLSLQEEISNAVRHTDTTKTISLTIDPFLSSSVLLNQPLTGYMHHITSLFPTSH